MAITAASIEANGYVLALKHNGGLGSFASYALSPDTTPALTLASTHPGFDVSTGQAVANAAKPRSFTGTKPLRKPAVVSNAGVLSAKLIDETDNGDGTVTVRIALSNWVYITDAALTLTALAGWRTGEAATTIAVVNNSTLVCPAPIHRWADVPYKLARGPYGVDLLVFGFFPQGNQPVAAVKLTVTDGTTVKTIWATALSTSPQYGDNLRCYSFAVDPSLATALAAGLHRIDAEVYPWIGSMRPTDPAGTKSMSTLTGDGYLGKAQAPLVVAWDPAGTRYPYKAVFVDFVNGTATATAGMAATGGSEAAALTAAKAVAPAARAKDAATAVEALRLSAYNLPAGNGQAGKDHSIDGAMIVLAAQTHLNGMGGGSVGYAPSTTETWLRITGDPADANPRQNVILRTNTSVSPSFQSPVDRIALSAMSIELGFDLNLWNAYNWWDNLELRGQAGQTTATHAPIGGISPPAGKLGLHVTNSRIWKTGVTLDNNVGGTQRGKLIRHVEHRRAAYATTCVKNRAISETEDPSYTGVLGIAGITGPPLMFTDDLSVYDGIVAYGDYRAIKDAVWTVGFLPAANTANPVYASSQFRRQLFFCNIVERIGSPPSTTAASVQPLATCGEGVLADMVEIIVEANTVTGDRFNWGYNDPPTIGANTAAGVASTDAGPQNSYVSVRVAGNVFAGMFCKQDRFDDPAVKAQRVAAGDPRNHGVRPGLLACYASAYAVGQRDNVNLCETPYGASVEMFLKEYEGLNGLYTAVPLDPKFTADRSRWQQGADTQSTATGVGDYTPLTGSPALARVASGNSDRDVLGNARGATFAAGAIQPATVVAVSLVPALTHHQSLASNPSVSWRAAVTSASARHVSRASVAALAWSSTVAGARNTLAMRSGVTGLSWTASISPSRSAITSRTATTSLSQAVTLAANRTALTTHAGPASSSWTTLLNSVRSTIALQHTTASVAGVSWAAPLAPARSALTTRVRVAALVVTSNVPPSSLAPGSTVHVLLDAFSLNLQPGGNDGASIRTIFVPSDFRVHSITLS